MDQGTQDFITILRHIEGAPVGKIQSLDENGRLAKSKQTDAVNSNAAVWVSRQVPVSDLESLYSALREAASDPSQAVIRGLPNGDVDTKQPHYRLVHADHKGGRPGAYKAKNPHRWLGLDLDCVFYDPSDHDPYGDPDSFVDWVVGHICEETRDVSCVYQFSSGAGLSAKGSTPDLYRRVGEKDRYRTKLRLWFWLDSPIVESQAKKWAKRVNAVHAGLMPKTKNGNAENFIDISLFSGNQWHYTADPILYHGVECAVRNRWGIYYGEKDELSIEIPAETENFVRTSTGERKVASAASVQELLEGMTSEGIHQVLLQIAQRFFRDNGPEADTSDLERAVAERLTDFAEVRGFYVADRMREFARLVDWSRSRAIEDATRGVYKAKRVEADLSAPSFPYPQEGTAEDVREKQDGTIRNWYAQAVINAVNHQLHGEDVTPYRLQITGPVGSGKTTSVEKIIRDFDLSHIGVNPDDVRINVFIATALNSKAAESAEEIPGAINLRGVDALDPNLPGEKMCWRAPVAKKIQEEGGSLSLFCQTCPHFRQCGYRQQVRDVAKANDETGINVYTGPQELLHYPSQVKGGWQIVIVDERYKAENEPISFPARGLQNHIDWSPFAYVPKEQDEAPEEPRTVDGRIKLRVDPELINAARKEIRKALVGNEQGILDALRNRPIPGFINERLDAKNIRRIAEALREAARHHRPFKEDGAPDFNTDAGNDEIVSHIDQLNTKPIIRLSKFFDALAAEFDAPRGQTNTIRIEGANPKQQTVKIYGFRRPSKVAQHAPVLLLDATGKLDLNRKIWGPELEEVRIDAENRADAVQLIRSDRWSKSSMLDNDGRASAKLRDVAYVINRFPGAFVATHKPVREALTPHLDPSIKTGHYTALRGLNEFADCEVGFFLCDPMVPPQGVLDLALSYGATDEQVYYLEGYDKEDRRFRMSERERREIAHEQPVCVDPTLETFRQILVEDEMLQAIGRVRAFWNPRTVYILSNRPYDQTLSDVATWGEFKDRLTVEDFGADAVIDSASWLIRAYPELARSRARASGYLAAIKEAGWTKREGVKGVSSDGKRYDVLVRREGGAPIDVDGWSIARVDNAPEGVNPIIPILLENGFVSLKPEWIVANSNGAIGSTRSAKREISRISADLVRATLQSGTKNYLYSTSLQSGPNPNRWFSVVRTDDGLAPRIEFRKFRYRVKGTRARASYGLTCGNLDKHRNRIEEALGPLALLEEVDFSSDEASDARNAVTLREQRAAIVGVDRDLTREKAAIIENVAADVWTKINGEAPMTLSEVARNREERETAREAAEQYAEAQIEILDDATVDEANEERQASFFDLTPAIKK